LKQPFYWPVRVYWEDTDGGGIVYYANYLRFMERARTEWLRALGIDQSRLATERGLIFTIVEVQIAYRRPARLDDELRVSCVAEAQGRASFAFTQDILRGVAGPGEELVASASTRAACLDMKTLKPRALPQELLNGLK
jgi:tol-pal system-associated acyl-CoA thioesterase